MKGQVIEVCRYTPGLWTGQRFVIEAEVSEPIGGLMIVVRELGGDKVSGPFWPWRFKPVLGEARNAHQG